MFCRSAVGFLPFKIRPGRLRSFYWSVIGVWFCWCCLFCAGGRFWNRVLFGCVVVGTLKKEVLLFFVDLY